ncbi:hypothetical protein C8A00DRAFT_47039 [Chaetomidium leptoderma]|uniref:Uncharacterized protein n=1 Tax=Chaetomidium leptoderma TaxID=669021 RepID=A0AAN6ZT61_9PEZI|nr:hypothetical protein C8A00DRAFT_47039 [Chaetomidium leptoderma]
MAITRPVTARVALFATLLLAQLQPALASFYTVTSYFVLVETTSKYQATCTEDCLTATRTRTSTVEPTITPTGGSTVSKVTRTYTYDDLQVVSIFLADGAVAQSDFVPTSTTRTSGIYVNYAVPVTWVAPSSCPTPFTFVTHSPVYVPYEVTAYITAVSTATSVYRGTQTYITKFLDATAVPTSQRPGNPNTEYYYTRYVESCSNPTASATSRSGSGGSWSGGGNSNSDWDWNVCSGLTGCVALATWVIVIAVLLPTLFLLGFIESYCWFRRMMLGKSALRLGTVCWCVMSLWFILLTRRSRARSKEDQVLLKQYWATLSAGTRIKFWFKYGLRWRYPVELLGNPDGQNPAVVMAPGVPPGQPGGGTMGDGAEKMGVNAQQQPVYMPYSGQPYPGQPYMQPVPGQPYPGQPGFAPQQGYMMPMPPQAAYTTGQQPGFAPPQPGDGQQQPQGQQQMYPPYVPTPSPVPTGTTELPSTHPTPPPGHDQQQTSLPPPGTQPHQ